MTCSAIDYLRKAIRSTDDKQALNQHDDTGSTLLHHAIIGLSRCATYTQVDEYLAIIEQMLIMGCNPDNRDNLGNPCLFYLIVLCGEYVATQCLDLMLQFNLDVDIKLPGGNTVLQEIDKIGILISKTMRARLQKRAALQNKIFTSNLSSSLDESDLQQSSSKYREVKASSKTRG